MSFPNHNSFFLDILIFVRILPVITSKMAVLGNTTAGFAILVTVNEVESALGSLWRVFWERVGRARRPGAPGGLAHHVSGWRVSTDVVNPPIRTLGTDYSNACSFRLNNLRTVSC